MNALADVVYYDTSGRRIVRRVLVLDCRDGLREARERAEKYVAEVYQGVDFFERVTAWQVFGQEALVS